MPMNETDKARVQYLSKAMDSVWNIASDFERSMDPDSKPDPAPDMSKTAEVIASEKSLDPEISRCNLSMLSELCSKCEKCQLSKTRTHVVFGTGSTSPLVMVIGEGPGFNEDQEGIPFVGQAGRFLDKWLESIHLSRDENAYICNVIKCRPPENRDPMDEEIEACQDYLIQQINLLKPKAILGLGRFACQFLFGSDSKITKDHGLLKMYRGIPAICTFHPAAVLRNLDLKRPVWSDLKKLAAFLGIPV